MIPDSFVIIISKDKTLGDLIEKITEERYVGRGVITLMLINETVFFVGSENPDFKYMLKDSDVLAEFLESEKSEDDIIELIYKEIEAGGKEQNRIGIKNATNENLLIAIRYEAIQYPKQRLSSSLIAYAWLIYI